MRTFMKQFFSNPRQTGAIARFSNITIKKALSKVDRERDISIIEL